MGRVLRGGEGAGRSSRMKATLVRVPRYRNASCTSPFGMARTPRETRDAHPRASDWVRLAVPFALIAMLIGVAWHFGYFNLKNPKQLIATTDRIRQTPWVGPIYVAVFAVAAALAVPIAPMVYVGGALFGFSRGALFGAAGGYLFVRHLWSDSAQRLLGRYRFTLRKLREGRPFMTTLRMQLLPVVPFGVFNYAAAAAKLPWIPYLAGTAIGIIPGTFATVFAGDRIMAGFRGTDRRPLWIGLGVAFGLIALSFVPTIVKKRRG